MGGNTVSSACGLQQCTPAEVFTLCNVCPLLWGCSLESSTMYPPPWCRLLVGWHAAVCSGICTGTCPYRATDGLQGVYKDSMAEFAIAACFYFARQFPALQAQQARHHWEELTSSKIR